MMEHPFGPGRVGKRLAFHNINDAEKSVCSKQGGCPEHRFFVLFESQINHFKILVIDLWGHGVLPCGTCYILRVALPSSE
jgi:hypothetical protein